MNSTLRKISGDFGQMISNPRVAATIATVIVLFAVIGPFGTFERLSLFGRFAYWTSTTLGAWAIALFALSVGRAFLPQFGFNPLVVSVLSTVIAAFPINYFVLVAIGLTFGDAAVTSFLDQMPYTVVMALSFGLIVHFTVLADADDTPNTMENPLIERLPLAVRGPVKYMSMQDHYVAVTTTKGRELVLMRMADAVSALKSIDGLQIHRSHWINRNHVSDTRRVNGKLIVTMDDGTEIPVSRTFAAAAREAGIKA